MRRWSERKSTGVEKRKEDQDEMENKKKKKASAQGHDGTKKVHTDKNKQKNICGDSETGSIMTR